MSSRTIRVLHIEDEESQRRLFAHHLGAMHDFQFDIHYADSVETALGIFRAGGVEFVILDYNLSQGNGLHCLKELRHLDLVVPIIAISGVATEKIVTDLVQGGVDKYINKRELTRSVLARSLRDTMSLADAWRERDAGYRSCT